MKTPRQMVERPVSLSLTVLRQMVGAPPAAGDDQAETRQPATPVGTAVSTNLPDPPIAPLA